MEYFKCHAGELAYVFGDVSSELEERDGLDVPFSQLVIDYWTAFVRTGNPNPDLAFLKARGYTNTVAQVLGKGLWAPVDPASPRLSLLQWGARESMKAFQDLQQCEVLGFPLDYFEA